MTPYLTQQMPPAAGGDVPADGAVLPGGRVGRVREPVLGGGVVQALGDHAGLAAHEPVGGVDLEDAVHPGGAQDDAAVDRVRGARETGAGALRDNGDAELVRGAHDVPDLLGGAREGDDGGGTGLGERRRVAGMRGEGLGVGVQDVGVVGEEGAQAGQEGVSGDMWGLLVVVGAGIRSQREGSSVVTGTSMSTGPSCWDAESRTSLVSSPAPWARWVRTP